MAIKVVFLDVDGTTVDSEQRNRRAIEEAARIGGHRIKPDDWDYLGGQGDNVIWSLISEFQPDFTTVFNNAASFERACLNAKIDRIHEVQKIEEVFDAIALFHRAGVRIAPVSNSITPDALASLEHAGYSRDDFAFCLFRDDLAKKGLRAKPHPDPYEEALRMMNAALKHSDGDKFVEITPSECLIFEDSKTGVRAGLAAGMSVLHITDEGMLLDESELEQLQMSHGGKYFQTLRAGIVELSRKFVQGELPDRSKAQCRISLNPQTFTPPHP